MVEKGVEKARLHKTVDYNLNQITKANLFPTNKHTAIRLLFTKKSDSRLCIPEKSKVTMHEVMELLTEGEVVVGLNFCLLCVIINHSGEVHRTIECTKLYRIE